jgi:hypothetical protein
MYFAFKIITSVDKNFEKYSNITMKNLNKLKKNPKGIE